MLINPLTQLTRSRIKLVNCSTGAGAVTREIIARVICARDRHPCNYPSNFRKQICGPNQGTLPRKTKKSPKGGGSECDGGSGKRKFTFHYFRFVMHIGTGEKCGPDNSPLAFDESERTGDKRQESCLAEREPRLNTQRIHPRLSFPFSPGARHFTTLARPAVFSFFSNSPRPGQLMPPALQRRHFKLPERCVTNIVSKLAGRSKFACGSVLACCSFTYRSLCVFCLFLKPALLSNLLNFIFYCMLCFRLSFYAFKEDSHKIK